MRAKHGGGKCVDPGSYDPETHLYIVGTGNPSPAYTNPPSREGDNLYTCSIVAINVDTGKMAWYYQTSPHDTHDWDSTETPVLVDGEFNGKPRKMVLHANRNGYYFTLDRVTGEHLVTAKFSALGELGEGHQREGPAGPRSRKRFHCAGVAGVAEQRRRHQLAAARYSPDTGLFYVPHNEAYAMYYLTETDPRGAMGLGGKEEDGLGIAGSLSNRHRLQDRQDRVAAPLSRHRRRPGETALLTTAGKLLFGGDLGGNLVAYDPANGKILWHSHLGQVSNAPETYMLDGHQFILIAAGDTLYAFTLY